MIAKCGIQRIPHWAHRSKRSCDSWYEPEKLWHRNWKNLFPPEWQEVVLWDRTGERHIADVRTTHGLTIEFQHSPIRPPERGARERFYKNMVWVVDGARLTRDWPRFATNFSTLREIMKGFFLCPYPEVLFPRSWIDSTVPVLFDFAAVAGEGGAPVGSQLLWCLLPGRVSGQAVLISLSREDFVREAHSCAEAIPVRTVMKNLADMLAHQRAVAQQAYLLQQQPWRWRRRRVRL